MRPNQKEEVIMVDGLFDDFKDKINYEIEKTREWVHSNSNKIDRLKANKSIFLIILIKYNNLYKLFFKISKIL